MQKRIAESVGQTGQHRERWNFSRFDGKRIAVVFQIDGRLRVVHGPACYQRDDLLGNVLVVRLEGDELGNPEIIFSEQEYSGCVVPDFRYGCDFCFPAGESDTMNGPSTCHSCNVPKWYSRRRRS